MRARLWIRTALKILSMSVAGMETWIKTEMEPWIEEKSWFGIISVGNMLLPPIVSDETSTPRNVKLEKVCWKKLWNKHEDRYWMDLGNNLKVTDKKELRGTWKKYEENMKLTELEKDTLVNYLPTVPSSLHVYSQFFFKFTT